MPVSEARTPPILRHKCYKSRHLLDWLITQKIQRVHACLESTGRYSLGIACALYEAGHVVSIINPAQVRDFVRTKLGRNKTDGIDASRIREYCELFKPSPWAPDECTKTSRLDPGTVRASAVLSPIRGELNHYSFALARFFSKLLGSTEPLWRSSRRKYFRMNRPVCASNGLSQLRHVIWR